MKPLPGWFRYASWFMAALLALSASLQYNDPDPLRWILIYGAGAIVSAALPHKREAWTVGLLIGLGASVWALVLTLQVWGVIEPADLWRKMSEKGGAVEVGREAGGLWIEGLWLLAASAFRRSRA